MIPMVTSDASKRMLLLDPPEMQQGMIKSNILLVHGYAKYATYDITHLVAFCILDKLKDKLSSLWVQ